MTFVSRFWKQLDPRTEFVLIYKKRFLSKIYSTK